jgi:hypothetical protein
MKPHFGINVAIALIIFLAGCGPVTPFAPAMPTETVEPMLTETVEPTPTYPAVFSDCGWDGIGFVWIDQNGDGEYQEGEQPIPDVPVLIDDTLNGLTDVGKKATTSSKGEANLSVWLPGCPDVDFEIYIQVPDGYTLTTPPRVKVQGLTQRFSFGLTYLPGVSTVTPLPPDPDCKILTLPTSLNITGFSINDNGTIWLGTPSNGIYSRVVGQADWTHWDERQGLISNNLNALEARYGYVWIATPMGVSVFDGETWQSYPEKDNLLSNTVNDIAVEKDGSAWFATDYGVFYFSLATKSWKYFYQIPGLKNFHFEGVDIASDWTVWFSLDDEETILRLMWPDHNDKPEWQIYSMFSIDNNVLYLPFPHVFDFAADTIGNIWFVGYGGFTRFNVTESTWIPEIFDFDVDFSSAQISLVTADSDGSVWMVGLKTLYHAFPAGTKADKDILLEYNVNDGLPQLDSLVSINVAPDGKVWLIMEHQIYECQFFD